MRFIADAMLGRLARWLRILGFDVLYSPDIEDRQVIRIAREQERAILTRDAGLLKNKGARNAILITSDRTRDQLRELEGRLHLDEAEPLGRCAVCNGTLSVVGNKGEVREAVPDFIYHTFNEFLRCGGCGRIYWRGSHQEMFRKYIGDILKIED
jgi:uncharacterized protein with PIN domain